RSPTRHKLVRVKKDARGCTIANAGRARGGLGGNREKALKPITPADSKRSHPSKRSSKLRRTSHTPDRSTCTESRHPAGGHPCRRPVHVPSSRPQRELPGQSQPKPPAFALWT